MLDELTQCILNEGSSWGMVRMKLESADASVPLWRVEAAPYASVCVAPDAPSCAQRRTGLAEEDELAC
eukprot:7765711-Pyramimonas_sp.AAC.1